MVGSTSSNGTEEYYEIEKILSHKKIAGGHYRFIVLWATGETTEEPAKLLQEDVPLIFAEYLRSSELSTLKRFAWAEEAASLPTSTLGTRRVTRMMGHLLIPVAIAAIVYKHVLPTSVRYNICPVLACTRQLVACVQKPSCRRVIDCIGECTDETSDRRKASLKRFAHVQYPQDESLCNYGCFDMIDAQDDLAEQFVECVGSSGCLEIQPAKFSDECANIPQNKVLSFSIIPADVLEGRWVKVLTNSWDTWPCQSSEFLPPKSTKRRPLPWMDNWPNSESIWRMDLNWTIPETGRLFQMSNELTPGKRWDHINGTAAFPSARTRAIMWGTEANEHWVMETQFAPSGSHLVMAGKDVESGMGVIRVWRWDEETDTNIEDTSSHTFVGHTGTIFTLQFSPDGTRLATGGADALVSLWDVSSMVCCATMPRRAKFIRSVSFSHDSQLVATANEEEGIDLTDAETGDAVGVVKLMTEEKARIRERLGVTAGGGADEVAFHPKGYVLACARGYEAPSGGNPALANPAITVARLAIA